MIEPPVPVANPSTVLKHALATPPGAFVEVGVYKGGVAWHLAEAARLQSRKLYLYDTFTGIPYADMAMGDQHAVGDFADTSLAAVRMAVPDAIISAGVFPDSLLPMDPVAFVHCDCDQYQSVRAVCEVMPRLMVDGGVILLDDYDCIAGAKRAVHDVFGEACVQEPLTGTSKGWVRIIGGVAVPARLEAA